MVVVDRANWGRLEPLAAAIQASNAFMLDIITTGNVQCEGYAVRHAWYASAEDSLYSTARTIGLGVLAFAEKLFPDRGEQRPDIVIIIGDRREALAAAIAAAHCGVKLVHLQGGETSSTLDQKYRWAITAMADYHVPATDLACHQLTSSYGVVPRPRDILTTGCPSSDLAREVIEELLCQQNVHLYKGYNRDGECLACYHPNTCHPETAAAEAEAFFSALPKDRPVTVLSTNPDAGRGPIVEAAKRYGYAMHNLEPREFARRMATCAIAVGNSSGFVRDSGFYGTPVVLVGDRQNGRERGENVMQVACLKGEIEAGIAWQLEHGPYPPSDLYGDGHVCERIVEALKGI